MPDNKKSFDLRTSDKMRYAGKPADSDLAEELIKLIGIAVAGGIALITGAKKFGESLQNMQSEAERKAEEQRQRYKEAVRQAVENEVETEYEAERDEGGLFMTPSPLEEQPETVDIILEASPEEEAAELGFEGQEEAEKKIENAMAEYDAAMDEAAGVK